MKRVASQWIRATFDVLDVEDPMTDKRLEAQPIPGEHCCFCGEQAVPLVKTPCCHHWICCDTGNHPLLVPYSGYTARGFR